MNNCSNAGKCTRKEQHVGLNFQGDEQKTTDFPDTAGMQISSTTLWESSSDSWSPGRCPCSSGSVSLMAGELELNDLSDPFHSMIPWFFEISAQAQTTLPNILWLKVQISCQEMQTLGWTAANCAQCGKGRSLLLLCCHLPWPVVDQSLGPSRPRAG